MSSFSSSMIRRGSRLTRYEYRESCASTPGNAWADTAAPPNWSSLSSTITRLPAWARYAAAVSPLCPPPMMATSYRAGALTRSGRRLRAAGGVDPLLLREHADLGAQSLEHVDRGVADGRPLVVAEHLEEQLADGAIVVAHGA